MSIVFVLIPIALALGGLFLASFALAAWYGQFDDLETPSYRILIDEEPKNIEPRNTRKDQGREHKF